MLTKEYVANWHDWHRARIEDVNRPYGWLSIVSQDWLNDGEFFSSDLVPGSWLLRDGEVYYYPVDQAVGDDDALLIDGERVTRPTHIPHGINKNSGTGSAVSVFYNELEVETITRINAQGEKITAVRVRNPEEAVRKRINDIGTFPLDSRWVVPARFTAGAVASSNVATVEAGIYETNFTLGTMSVAIDGAEFELDVFGHRGGSEATGYVIDLMYVHIGDLTSGKETYGGGRVVILDPSELHSTQQLDFNRLVSFPCALSTFITCPTTPANNRLPIRVTAGELTPPVNFDRVPTYKRVL